MRRKILFSREAEQQLLALYRYIATASTPEIAARYTDALVTHCEKLETFSERGMRRDDIRPGLRITNYRKRTSIAFVVRRDRIEILGFFHRGQDYRKALEETEED